MPFAKSQFFFLRNLSISSAALSCGSTKLCLEPVRSSARNGSKVLDSFGVFSRISYRSRQRPQPNSIRAFSTFTHLQSDAPSAEFKEAVNTFKQAYKGKEEVISKARRTFPINSSRSVGYWLVGSAGLVFGIVVLGGLTRLTESGLSITEWKPVTGTIPPTTETEWEHEFSLYKKSPEFKILNANITLDEFKSIFYMEWAHRVWGRMIGLTFVIPAAYFVFARRTSKQTTRRLFWISALIGLQGFIGWWMVKSGLNEEFLHQPGAQPRVSQYRLATHLGAAFILYAAMINTGLQVLRENRWIRRPAEAIREISAINNPVLSRFKLSVAGLLCLVFATAMSGAFVAGLDAGLIYNSFPYMGETIIPPMSELFNPLYASNSNSSFNLVYNNLLENPTTVQLTHRILATSTLFATLGMHLYSIKLKPFMPKPVFKAGAAAMGFVTLQVALGITTLIYVVPTHLAATHQAGSLALLTSVLVLASRLKLPRPAIQRLLANLTTKSLQRTKQRNTKRN